MTAIVVNSVYRYRRTCIDNDTGGLNFGPGTDHRDPTVDTHTTILLVAVVNSKSRFLCFGKAQITTAVCADDSGEAGRKAGARNIARDSRIHRPRQPR